MDARISWLELLPANYMFPTMVTTPCYFRWSAFDHGLTPCKVCLGRTRSASHSVWFFFGAAALLITPGVFSTVSKKYDKLIFDWTRFHNSFSTVSKKYGKLIFDWTRFHNSFLPRGVHKLFWKNWVRAVNGEEISAVRCAFFFLEVQCSCAYLFAM